MDWECASWRTGGRLLTATGSRTDTPALWIKRCRPRRGDDRARVGAVRSATLYRGADLRGGKVGGNEGFTAGGAPVGGSGGRAGAGPELLRRGDQDMQERVALASASPGGSWPSSRSVDLARVDGWVVVRVHGGRSSIGGDCVHAAGGDGAVLAVSGSRAGEYASARRGEVSVPRTVDLARAVVG